MKVARTILVLLIGLAAASIAGAQDAAPPLTPEDLRELLDLPTTRSANVTVAPATRPAPIAVLPPARGSTPAAAPTPIPTPRPQAILPATKPAKDDLLTRAEDAIDHDGLAQLDARLSPDLVDAMSNPAKIDQERLVRLATAREIGRFFSRVATISDEDRAALKWFVEKPRFSQTLMMALSDQDAPDNILSMIKRLEKDQHDAIEKIPDLATALCLTSDKPGFTPDNTEKPMDIDRPITELHYYLAAGGPGKLLKFNLHELPWQLAVYVVDERLSFGDLKTAADGYGSRGGLPSRAFWDVAYRPGAKYGDAGDAASVAPTLGQILQNGGSSVEQALVGAQVAKVLGDPACTIKAADLSAAGAKKDSGGDRSWTLCLDGSGLRPVWNTAAARYPEYAGWPGTTNDPQTQEELTEADVLILSEVPATNIKARLAAQAMVKTIDLIDETKRLDVYEAAVQLSPGNRSAWFALADAASSRQVNAQTAAGVVKLVQRLLRQRQPEFAVEMLKRSWQGRGTDEQLAEYDKLAAMFGDRPDLVAAVLIAKGDVLSPLRPRDAVNAYARAMTVAPADGPMVIEAINRLDVLMRAAGDLPDLYAAYDQALSRMPAPAPSVYGDTTPFHILGEQFASLMDEAGNAQGAKQLRDQLGKLKVAVKG